MDQSFDRWKTGNYGEDQYDGEIQQLPPKDRRLQLRVT